MPSKIVWNDELDDALRALIKENRGRDYVSEQMGISWPTLRKRCHELGIEVRSSQKRGPRSDNIIALFDKGLSRREIAQRTPGISYKAVVGVLHRARQRG